MNFCMWLHSVCLFAMCFMSKGITGFMVCSHSQRPRPYMIGWRCSYCTETKTYFATNVIGYCTHFINLCLGIRFGLCHCECTENGKLSLFITEAYIALYECLAVPSHYQRQRPNTKTKTETRPRNKSSLYVRSSVGTELWRLTRWGLGVSFMGI